MVLKKIVYKSPVNFSLIISVTINILPFEIVHNYRQVIFRNGQSQTFRKALSLKPLRQNPQIFEKTLTLC